MNKFSYKPVAAMVCLALSGCSNTDHIASNEGNEEKIEQLSEHVSGEFDFNTQRLSEAPYEYVDDFYVLGGAYEMREYHSLPRAFDLPSSLNEPDDMSVDGLLNQLNKMYQKYGIVINIDNDARKHITDNLEGASESSSTDTAAGADDSTGVIPISLIDSGSLTSGSGSSSSYKFNLSIKNASLRQILDLVTANTNTWWKYADGRVTIYRFDKETFVLDTTDQSFTKTFEQKGSSGGDENSVGSTFSASGVDAKPLDQIQEQIELLLTDDGRVFVNQFEKTVTIRDTPDVLKSVKSFLDDHNYRATTSYGVVIDVFEIISEIKDDRGVDWEAVFKSGDNKFGINSPGFSAGSSAGNLDIEVGLGNWNLKGIIAALNSHASIYSHIHKTGVTKNNIPTIVSSVDDRALVSGRSVTINSDGLSQESIETKIIDEGFTITTRPRLTSRGKIDLEVTVNTKVIKDVKTFGDKSNEVQLEETRRQNNMANVIMRDGDHAIVSAYEKMLTSADMDTLAESFPWWAGGKDSKRRYKSNLIVVVQPTIKRRR